MSAPNYILHDDQWKMTENYNEWRHSEMLLWFQGLNDDGFYSEYEDVFIESNITGRDFEYMMNSSFAQERFGMEADIASQLADVVKQRVKEHSQSKSVIRSIYNPSHLEPKNEKSLLALSESLVDIIVPKIKCECCDKIKLDEQNLYQCIEEECKTTKSGQICCERCFDIYHKIIFHRRHQFDINNENIVCINDMVNSFRNSDYENGEKAPLQMKRFQRFNKIQNWFGTLTTVLTAGTGEATTYLTSSAEMMASITGMTGEIVLSTLGTALLGGGVGAALSFGIEVCAIFWRYWHGKIETPLELIRLICKSAAGHVVAFGGFMGGFVGITAIFGTVGGAMGPVGVGVGIVMGIFVGLALRFGANKIFDKCWKSQENNARIDLERTALDFFHFSDVSIMKNKQMFNKKEITRRYHGFALMYHPDMNRDKIGDEKEQINITWLALCSYYGILTAICDERDNNTELELVENVNNTNEECLSLLDH